MHLALHGAHSIRRRRKLSLRLFTTLALTAFTRRDPKKCLSIQDTILEQLTNRAAAPQAEVRVHAVRSLALIVESMTASEFVQPPLNSTILQTFHSALNDYTINERGDVGSLVRLEGLIAMGQVWQKSSILAGQTSKWMTACVGAVHRLALEKLDKVRLQAALCLEAAGMNVGIWFVFKKVHSFGLNTNKYQYQKPNGRLVIRLFCRHCITHPLPNLTAT